FVDYRTWAALRTNAAGQTVAVTQTVTSAVSPVVLPDETNNPPASIDLPPGPLVMAVGEREVQTVGAAKNLSVTIERRGDAPVILVPLLRMSTVRSRFSL